MQSRSYSKVFSSAIIVAIALATSACGGSEPCEPATCENHGTLPSAVSSASIYCDREPMPPGCNDTGGEDPGPVDPPPTYSASLKLAVTNEFPTARRCYLDFALRTGTNPSTFAPTQRVFDGVVQPHETISVGLVHGVTSGTFGAMSGGGCVNDSGTLVSYWEERTHTMNATCKMNASTHVMLPYCSNP